MFLFIFVYEYYFQCKAVTLNRPNPLIMLDFYEIKLLIGYNALTFIENQLSIFDAILERIGNIRTPNLKMKMLSMCLIWLDYAVNFI